MTQLSREQIKDCMANLPGDEEGNELRAICDMALAWLEVQPRLKELEEGLRPFAKEFARGWNGKDTDSMAGEGIEITLGDLRRAASLLEGK